MEAYKIKNYTALSNLYAVSEKTQNTPHIEIHLKENINIANLENVLQKVLPQFPYLQVSLLKENDDYYFIRNTNQVKIATSLTAPINMESDTNNYLFLLSVVDNVLCMNCSHAIGDGVTMFGFLRALLEEYFLLESGNVISPMADSIQNPIDFGEYVKQNDVYRLPIFEEREEKQSQSDKEINPILLGEESTTTVTKKTVITVAKSELEKIAKEYDVPAYMLLIKWINDAIRNLSEDWNRPISFIFIVNMRNILGTYDVKGNCVLGVPVVFSNTEGGMENESYERYQDSYRQIRQQLRKSKLISQMKIEANTIKEISALSSRLKIKKKVYERAFLDTMKPTYWISVNEDYFSNFQWKEKVENVYAWNDPIGSQMGVEVVTFADKLNLCISYKMQKDDLMASIAEKLKSMDLEVSVGEIQQYREVVL